MTSNKLSKKDQDFADAMALKLRLNRERLAEQERERKLIAEAMNLEWRLLELQ